MRISEWLREAETQLADSGCPDARVDARWMAEDALHATRTQLKFEEKRALLAEEERALNDMLERRLAGEPLQYILGSAPFMGFDFHVDKRVLIPRQDTETLAESALTELKGKKEPRVLDLCTGSGAIGLSIGALHPGSFITLTDISRDALEVAARNAKALGVQASIRQGDLFEAVAGESFDLIVSNPPYIPKEEIAGLQREVRREPVLALDGGEDGLDFYRRIADGAGTHLNAGGSIFLEVGIRQAEQVRIMLRDCLGCAETGVIRDLCGVDRVVWGKL